MNTEILKQLQEVELEILVQINKFCVENDINYSLYAGTALGAVRHNGFIPWDDDIDIVMTRDNYEMFCELWKNNPIKGYFLQNVTTDLTCGISHTKIRKDNTLLLSRGEDVEKGHHGIWVDIFVWDKVKNNSWAELYMKWNCIKKVIFTRGYAINSEEVKWRQHIKGILRVIPKAVIEKHLRKIELNLQKYKNLDNNFMWMSFSSTEALKYKYSLDMTEKYVTISFEKKEFMIFEAYHEMLRAEFGDYMKLPPEKERVCKHNPEIIKFE